MNLEEDRPKFGFSKSLEDIDMKIDELKDLPNQSYICKVATEFLRVNGYSNLMVIRRNHKYYLYSKILVGKQKVHAYPTIEDAAYDVYTHKYELPKL